MTLGENIRIKRKLLGLTQEQLALKSSISRTYLADVERDRYNPSIETLKLIADSLNSTISELLGEEPNDKITEYENQNKILFSKFGKLSESDRKKIIKMIEIFEEETQD